MKKSMQITYLKGWFRKWIDAGVIDGVNDIAEIDFEAEVDDTLTYKENLEHLKELYNYAEEPNEEDYAIAGYEHHKEVERLSEENFKNSIKELKGGEHTKYFEGLRSKVEMVGGGYANSLIVEGTGGIGKTYEVLRTLGDMNADFVICSSYSTPLSFYHKLYENNGKVIVLDDFQGVLDSAVGLSILKACLWSTTSVRTVGYDSTSGHLEAPRKFNFTGRIIFCVNKLTDNADTQAFKTRALYYKLDFPLSVVKEIIMSIAKGGKDYGLMREERAEIAQYILDNSDEATRELNLRTLIKAYGAYKYAKTKGKDWKKEIIDLLDVDEDKKLIKDLMSKHSGIVKDVGKEFTEITGKSRATFFRIKKEMGLNRDYKV